MKVLISGGGTGGHVFPALCVAEEFRENFGDTSVVFVGARGGIEERIVPERGFMLRTLKIKGLRGKNFYERAKNFMYLTVIFPLAVKILFEERPDAVIGFGGYASGPLVFSASMLRYITAIHEQNVLPGLTNRILGNFVNVVFTGFEESRRYFKKKVIHSGIPVRKELLKETTSKKADRFTILVLGGSQGAHALNKVMVNLAEEFDWFRKNVALIHQTGKADLKWVEDSYRKIGIQAEVKDFIQDMEDVYARSDLVVARAGASTLAELSALGKPSILIPYPFAAGNHQLLNAREFVKNNAAELLQESELTPEVLFGKIKEIIESPEKLQKMSQGARALFKPDSAKIIVRTITDLIEEKRRGIV